MAKLPTVAIIGRPNTGKSTLFNRLVGGRRAIVSDIPGTTRDHVSARVEGEEVDYLLVDTGGMCGGTDDTDFEDDVHSQSLIALGNADLILFVVNSREELTASDYEVVDALRKNARTHVSVFLLVAKCDNPETTETIVPQFMELGIAEEIIPISAFHGLGMDELETKIEERLSALHFGKILKKEDGEHIPRIAIVGKPNVGKSSIVNALMSNPQREVSPLLVSDVPGTTRDSTDTVIKFHEKEYCFVDTAGLRKKKGVDEEIEIYSVMRTIRAVEEADITMLVLDGTQEIVKQDKHIAGLAIERGSGLIILVNKVDMMDAEAKQEKLAEIEKHFPFCTWVPVLFCSAETRTKLPNLFEMIEQVHVGRSRKIPTPELNSWYRDVLETHQGAQLKSSMIGGKYLTQVETNPPSFVVFVKDPKRLCATTLRFLENRLRDKYDFTGTPLIWWKKRK